MSGIDYALQGISHKGGDLYGIELLPELEIVFRLPSYKRATQYQTLISATESTNNCSDRLVIYEHIFVQIVEDEWFAKQQDMPAGIIETIVGLALLLSGVHPTAKDYTQQLFDQYRSESAMPVNFMKRLICGTFSGYTFEQIDELTYPQIVYDFIQAEQLLLDRKVIEEPFAFEDPKKSKEQPKDKIDIDELIKEGKEIRGESPSELQKQAYMNRLRQQAKERAEEEERKYYEQLTAQQQKARR